MTDTTPDVTTALSPLTAIQTLPTSDLLESLDFQPPCEAKDGCSRPADWFGQKVCGCPVTWLACDPHLRADQGLAAADQLILTCLRCGFEAPYPAFLRWVRVR